MSSTFSTWPTLRREDVITFQFSSWYPTFSALSIKSTVVHLADDFRSYLEDDGVFVPAGSEDVYVHHCPAVNNQLHAKRSLRSPSEEVEHVSDDDDDEATSPAAKQYAFPELDAQIRAAIDEYGAVFPKLNFSSPKARSVSWEFPNEEKT